MRAQPIRGFRRFPLCLPAAVVVLGAALAPPSASAAPVGALSQLRGSAGCVADAGHGGCARGRGIPSPISVAVSPDGRRGYAASFSGAVGIFARDRRTGALRQLRGRAGCVSRRGRGGRARGRGLAPLRFVTVSPDGRSVYIFSLGGVVAVFARNRRTGAIRQLRARAGCLSADGGAGCAHARVPRHASVAVSPDGRSLYLAGGAASPGQPPPSLAVFSRDRRTGGLSQLPGAAGCLSRSGEQGCASARGLGPATSVALSPDGHDVYVTSTPSAVAVLSRDPASGALVQRPGGAGCVNRDGADGCERARFGDPAAPPGSTEAVDVELSPDGRGVYVPYRFAHEGDARPSGSLATFAREPATGALTQVAGEAAFPLARNPLGVAVSPDGRSVYLANDVVPALRPSAAIR